MDDTVEYRHPTLSIVCRVSSYVRRILTTRSTTVVVYLLVVVLIDDCWFLYVYLHISTIRWYYWCCLFVVYDEMVHHLIALFASFLPLLLLLLIVIYVDVGIYDETIIMDWVLVCWWWCILPCSCPSIPTRKITTLLFLVYTINWVILLIVLYDGIMLV